jgi:hypothetical protein
LEDKTMAIYNLTGRITNPQGEPLPGLTVRAYVQTPRLGHDLLGEAATNDDGRYVIRFSKEQFQPGGEPTSGPDIYIRVFAGGEPLGESSVQRNVGQSVSISLRVDVPQADEPPEPAFRISGILAQLDGRPVAGAVVRAFHKTLRTGALLGEAVSDRTGRYAITYTAEDLGRAGKGRANLIVRAFDASNTLLSESPIRFQAKAAETINLIVAREDPALSPFERTVKQLGPLLDGAALADLREDEIAFLASASSIAAADIVPVVMAERAAKMTGLPAAAFHGYLTARQSEQRGALAGFWRRLAADFGIRREDTARFRFLAQAGEMVGFDLPLIEALLAKLNHEEILGALDLALWDADQWLALLETAWADEALSLPPWAQGRTRDEQLRQAATTISDQATRIFPAKTVSALLVSGRVATPNKRPAADVAVQAFHHDLDREIAISPKVRSDAVGGYRIVIDPDILRQRAPSLDRLPLQLRLLAWAGDEESPAGQTEIMPGATLPLALDITVTREVGPTEFQRVADRIRGALGDTPPEKIAPDRLNWLAGATALDLGTTQRYVSVHELAEGTTFPAEALYGLFHPAIEPAERSDHETAESRLRRAVATGLVGEPVLQHIDAVEAWVKQREIEAREREIQARVAELKQPAPEGRPARPADIVRAARLPSEVLDTFIRLAAEHPAEDTVALQKRLAEAGIAGRERATIRTALRLAELVGPDAALVGALLQTLPRPDLATAENDEPAIALLARWSAETWVGQLQSHYPKQSAAEVARQARVIEGRLEGIYPTDALLGRLEERAIAGDATGDAAGDQRPVVDLNALRRALEGRRDIDLRGKGLKFQDLRDVPEPVQQDLEKLQRLARVAPFREAITLLEMGYASARDIAVTASTPFVDKFVQASKRHAGTAAREEEETRRQARDIHHHAVGQSAAAVATASVLTPALRATDPAAIGGSVRRPEGGANATMEKLFGAFDACSVAPCESVLGLPAYLVDLLELLENAADDRHPNPNAVLEQRRPDIFHLELSCANAETLLPTIDLVIELLEDGVAPVSRQPGALDMTKKLRKLAPAVSADLLQKKPVGETPTSTDSTAVAPPRYRQTTWSTEELLAYPEHLNAAAYAKLASDEALFPWNLPFSLPHAEADIYLEDLGTRRDELMGCLRRFPTAGQQALERPSACLGLNPTTRKIILGQIPAAQPWRCWGYSKNIPPTGWPASVGADVKDLLARTGLAYADLIELLATAYINPNRAITIEMAAGADACDLSRARLANVDAPFLDRFHRFARLWLHLGCSVRELDRAVAILGGQDINARFLIALAEARRLASRLKLPLAAILPFWGDIDTEASLDRAPEPIKRRPSQYEVLFLDKSKLSAAERQRLALPFDPAVSLDILSALTSAALGLDTTELALLTSPDPALALSEVAVSADKPLPLLSAFYRWRTLAQALALPIRDLLRLRALSGIDPFASPAATLQFLDALDALRRHEMSVDDLDFTLRHVTGPERLRRFEEEGRKLLLRVRNALLKQGAQPPGNGFAAGDVEAILCREVAHLCRLSNQAVTAILSRIEVGEPEPKSALTGLAEWLHSESWEETSLEGPAWRAYVQLMKSARLYARMNLGEQALQTPAEVALAPLRVLPPNDLPAQADPQRPLAARRSLFAKWLELGALAEVQDRLAAKPLSLWAVRDEAARAASRVQSWRTVAVQVGDSGLDVATLIGPALLALVQSVADAAPSVWRGFLDAVTLVNRLGVPVGSLVRWADDGLDLITSAEMRATAAARRTPEEWRARAPQLRHRLREKQRAALLAWVRVNQKVNSVDELHADYLVDLEMGPEQMTTRIALATASVQRFVQRALLGSERASSGRPVVLPEDFADAWEWMQSYPTWSNARKVFLYPENFLTPEIRDDKSPFFVELEQQLSQRALSDQAIEDAIGQYLQKLDEVARLEIMGSCVEEIDGEQVLHIVGRTRGIPHSYFHRTWNIAGGGFTPWVKLDLDIDGDWVIPVVFDGRLTLYWVKHTKQLEGMADIVGLIPTRPFPLSPHYPMFQDQYTLSWSTRQRKGWTRKQIAERPIARPFNPLMPAQFAVRLDPDRMRIAGVTLLPQVPRLPGKMVYSKSLLNKVVGGVIEWVQETGGNIAETISGGSHDESPNNSEENDNGSFEPETIIPAGDPLEALNNILKQLQDIQTDIIDKLSNLPNEVWNKFSTTLKKLPGKVWNLLPEDIQQVITFLQEQIDNIKTILEHVVNFITPPEKIPERVVAAAVTAGTQFIADLGTVLKTLWRLIQEAGLSNVLGHDLALKIQDFVNTTLQSRPGWAGPVPGFEFGFFDVGEGGARGLRLTPPPFFGDAILVGGGLAAGAAAAPAAGLLVTSLAPLALSLAPALLAPLIALNESARLIYSMFPGYPAFHDMPVLTGVLSTELPLMDGLASTDERIRAWPGSGYFITPSIKDMGAASYCSIAVNLKQMALEEVSDLEFPLSDSFNPTIGKVKELANDFTGFMEGVADKFDDLASLLNVGMRVIRPLPFGGYPGRLYNPSPIIIGEERHSRNFLLYQGVEENERRIRTWHVVSLYHPLTASLNRAFDRDGIPGLYASGSKPDGVAWRHGDRPRSQTVFPDTFWISHPDSVTAGPPSQERLDLTQAGAYALYNWELFFHIPMLIAGRLARQQSFAQALAWYRKVFDPTVATGPSPRRFWRFKQFHEDYHESQPYQNLIRWLTALADGSNDEDQAHVVAAWRRDPFNPHRVARLRAGAYARSVVMRTVETLVNWGDARFRDGSWEAVNEATQLYLLAREILGPRPQLVPARHAQTLTYQQLADAQGQQTGGIDAFGNALLTVESALSPLAILDDDASAADPSLAVLSGVSMLYFGIPANERLFALWDTIEDRLFKIRGSQDFSGRARMLLPPGLNLTGALMPGARYFSGPMTAQSQTAALRLPPYRFPFMLQKAYEFAGEVKAFGAALLSAAEKRDAEQLARLRSGHEVTLAQAMRRVRELQIVEAEHALAAARQGREGAQTRFNYYSSKEFISAAEMVKEVLSVVSSGLQFASGVQELGAAVMHALPNVTVGGAGVASSPTATVSYGSTQLAGTVSATARAISLLSSVAQIGSAMAGTYASYQRRQEEWDHQAKLAENDLAQFEQQIAGANARLEIARRELENHERQLANANEIATYMQEKFTNEELYEWMLEQAALFHFQSYLLAVDVARRTEDCFRYERAPSDAGFIMVEQWDDLRAGLMAGDRLQHDLRRMEKVYLEQNTREHELTKHVSLAQVDPVALLLLRQSGECFISLPEYLFDADHPGHYLRRIKSVSLSVPSVVGPYTSVNCRLSLLRSEIRVNPNQNGYTAYPRERDAANPDERFVDANAEGIGGSRFVLSRETAAMVTSHAQGDSGLFETNLRDERYLPFEGAGAISTWRIELPKATNRFDPATISDVVIHLRYTARDGGSALREHAWEATFGTGAPANLPTPQGQPLAAPRKLMRLFSARHDFADAWHRFLHPAEAQQSPVLDLDLSRDRFPYYPPELNVVLKAVTCVFVTDPAASAEGMVAKLNFVLAGGGPSIEATPTNAAFTADPDLASLAACEYTSADGGRLGLWQLRIAAADNAGTSATILEMDTATDKLRLDREKIDDLFVLCSYDLEGDG